MSAHDLPMGDRKIAEMLGTTDSETGVALRNVIQEQIQQSQPTNLATQEYVTAMSVAFS